MTSRVVVFIDYENMHRCASNEFAVGNGHFWPWDLGNELVARRNADPTVPASELTQVLSTVAFPTPAYSREQTLPTRHKVLLGVRPCRTLTRCIS